MKLLDEVVGCCGVRASVDLSAGISAWHPGDIDLPFLYPLAKPRAENNNVLRACVDLVLLGDEADRFDVVTVNRRWSRNVDARRLERAARGDALPDCLRHRKLTQAALSLWTMRLSWPVFLTSRQWDHRSGR